MIKCEVLDNTVLAIGTGSIVYVSERQYNLARKVLKPINEETKVETTENVEEVKVPKKETRKKKKEN